MKGAGVSIVVFVGLWLAVAPARAHPGLDQARADYEAGQIKQTLVRLQDLEANPALTEDDLVQLWWLRASCNHALGDMDARKVSFERLLGLRPLHQPSKLDGSPDLRAAFQQVAEQWLAVNGVQLGQPVLDGRTMLVQVARHASQVAEVVVYVRPTGESVYAQFPVRMESERANVKLADDLLWKRVVAAGGLDVVLEGRNVRGTTVARMGDANQPVHLSTAPPKAAVAATEPSPSASPAAAPTSSGNARGGGGGPSPLLLAALGVGGAGGVSLILSVVAGLVGAGSYVGMLLQPQEVGVMRTAPYRALHGGYLGGLVLAMALGGVAVLTVTAAVALGVVSLVL